MLFLLKLTTNSNHFRCLELPFTLAIFLYFVSRRFDVAKCVYLRLWSKLDAFLPRANKVTNFISSRSNSLHTFRIRPIVYSRRAVFGEAAIFERHRRGIRGCEVGGAVVEKTVRIVKIKYT